MKKQTFGHVPVLVHEVLDSFKYLREMPEPIFVDGTLGLGGHSLAIANQITNSKRQGTNRYQEPKFKVVGIDKDQNALDMSQDRVNEAGFADNFIFVHDNFKNIKEILSGLNIDKVDGILLDLGVSSMQIDDKERGFSYSDPDKNLDMRMDQSQELDAYHVINRYSEHELGRVLRDGEEKFFKSIARNIVKRRRERPVTTVGDLSEIIKNSMPSKVVAKNLNSFAADTFRAIRLEVNDELAGLKESIQDCIDRLNPGGRLAVITFHSLEDRIVKNTFRNLENPCTCPKEIPYCVCGLHPVIKIITKKPLVPSKEELGRNSRSKSSKLRVAEKL